MTMRKLEFALAAASLLFAAAIPAMAQDQGAAASEAKKLESLLVKAQGICPVMGKDLTKMGGPVKAKVGEQTIFLCCNGCLGKDIKPEHWAQIQANFKKAQKRCPVRNVSLGDEAVPVVVNGRTLYVCCNGGYCIKQVQDHPDKYVAIVNEQLARSFEDAER